MKISELKEKYQNIFLRHPDGKVVWEDLCNKYDKSSYLKNVNTGLNPYEMAYREGRRYVIDQIKKMLKSDNPS